MAAQDLSNKKQAYIDRYIASAKAFLDARLALVGEKSEWDANGYNPGITQADISKGNQLHLTPVILANGWTTQIAIESLLAANGNAHLTNLNALVGV